MAFKSKSLFRKEIKNRLKSLPESIIQSQSDIVTEKVCSHGIFKAAAALSIYLSMPQEINTDMVIRNAFLSNKRVFIPKVTGPNAQDMLMVELDSYETIEQFPKNGWGIPEPSDEYISSHIDMTFADIIDLVFVPGVVFDKGCGRIGHGRGYYDCFLSKISENASDKQIWSVGLALDEQVIDEMVPRESHDRLLDIVVSSSATYQLNK